MNENVFPDFIQSYNLVIEMKLWSEIPMHLNKYKQINTYGNGKVLLHITKLLCAFNLIEQTR